MKLYLMLKHRDWLITQGIPPIIAEAHRLWYCAQRRQMLMRAGMSKKYSARLVPERGYRSFDDPILVWQEIREYELTHLAKRLRSYHGDEQCLQLMETLCYWRQDKRQKKINQDMMRRHEAKRIKQKQLLERARARGARGGYSACAVTHLPSDHPMALASTDLRTLVGLPFSTPPLCMDDHANWTRQDSYFGQPRLLRKLVLPPLAQPVEDAPLWLWELQRDQNSQRARQRRTTLPAVSFLERNAP